MYLIFVSCLLAVSQAAKVLFLPSTLYTVHPYTMKHLAVELVSRGHQVTWVEHGPAQSKVSLPKEVNRVFWPVKFGVTELDDTFVHMNHSSHSRIWDGDFWLENEQTTAWLAGTRLCDRLLSGRHREQYDKIVKEKFDTVIVDDLYNPCGLLMAGLKGSVYIYWSMTSLRTESAWANQSPSPPSYLPVPGTKLTDELTTLERMYNLASYMKALYIHQIILHTRIDKVFQKHYPGVESAFFIERNASINFVNTPPIFDFARPFMPRVNFVGGLHCKNATELTGSLKTFVDAASEEHGFVLITSGFTAQWKKAPKATKDLFLSVFRQLPNVQFVWQYNGEKLNLPKNVFVSELLPQQNLLGHKKIVAHVSHGGLNSVIESVWHGVPTIGLPLTVRGYDNLLRITARGCGIMLEKGNLTVDSFVGALKEIRQKKYKDEMLVFQDMVRDVPYTELTHAAFWVEFIERHQEVPHARSGADKLNVFQYFLVDVLLFLFSLLATFVALVYYAIRTTFRILRFFFRLVFGGSVPQKPAESTKTTPKQSAAEKKAAAKHKKNN